MIQETYNSLEEVGKDSPTRIDEETSTSRT